MYYYVSTYISTIAPGTSRTGRKRAASSAAFGSGRPAPSLQPQPLASARDFSPTHFDEPHSDVIIPSPQQSVQLSARRSSLGVAAQFSPLNTAVQGGNAPLSPMRVDPQRDITPYSSPVSQNPLLRLPSRSALFRTRDGNLAWAATTGLLPITAAFTAPGFVPAQVVGGVTYTVRSPRDRQPTITRPDVGGRKLFSEYMEATAHIQGSPTRQQHADLHNSEPQVHSHAPSHPVVPASAHVTTQNVVPTTSVPMHANTFGTPRAMHAANRPSASGPPVWQPPLHYDVTGAARRPSASGTPAWLPPMHSISPGAVPANRPSASGPPVLAQQYDISPDLLLAIARALGQAGPSSALPRPPARRYFANAITTQTSDLPIPVIKELKAGFKNYIPLALCTHKACLNATRSLDAFDTEFGLTDKGEIKLKQKTMSAAKDYYLTTDDFSEVRKNFIRGLRKCLIMGEDVEPGGARATDCADMFADFFSVIAARPDYTRDWPSYRGYIIESYTSWVGRVDDTFGLFFDEHLFTQHRLAQISHLVQEQLRQPGSGSSSGRGGAGPRGRGRGFQGTNTSTSSRGGFHAAGSAPSFLSQSTASFTCW